jgi:hypothetical protein
MKEEDIPKTAFRTHEGHVNVSWKPAQETWLKQIQTKFINKRTRDSIWKNEKIYSHYSNELINDRMIQ